MDSAPAGVAAGAVPVSASASASAERPFNPLDSLAAAAEDAAKMEEDQKHHNNNNDNSTATTTAEHDSRSSSRSNNRRNPTAWIHETPKKIKPEEGEEEEYEEDEEGVAGAAATTTGSAAAATKTATATSSARNGSSDAATKKESATATTPAAMENGTPTPAGGQPGRKGAQPKLEAGTAYSGGKIKHLKKEDGTPLWRKDIQFSFLKAVFEDDKPVFTSFEDGSTGHSFADIYIRAMAHSSKCSKVLRDKLLGDKESAMNMAMICLLVNVGRMNTTLNFFPEMRAQLRTYHAIPCLQADQDPNSGYKGLQDAPRLKSILKGAQEDVEQPNTLGKIEKAAVPRTNPVNLIFILSQYASTVSDQHFNPPVDFFDLIIRGTLSSKSRARAFLWLLWWYLESDFSDKQARENPFGSGMAPPDDTSAAPIKVPDFDSLSEEQAEAENVDTEEEKAYGWKMKDVRKRILENDEGFSSGPRRAGGGGVSGGDRLGSPRIRDDLGAGTSPAPTRGSLGSRSPSPSSHTPLHTSKSRGGGGGDSHASGKRPVGRVSYKLNKESRLGPGSSPAPPGSAGHPIFSTSGIGGGSSGISGLTLSSSAGGGGRGRNRPETSHQRAVHANKQARINKILHTKLREAQREVRARNKAGTLTQTGLALQRIMALPDDYDSEEENAQGPGGLVPLVDELGEEEDYGAEATKVRKMLNRACRRLGRDGSAPLTALGLAGVNGTAGGVNGSMSRRRGRVSTGTPLGDDDAMSVGTVEDGGSVTGGGGGGGSRRFGSGRGRSGLGRSPLAQRHGPPAEVEVDRMDSDLPDGEGEEGEDLNDTESDSGSDVDMIED